MNFEKFKKRKVEIFFFVKEKMKLESKVLIRNWKFFFFFKNFEKKKSNQSRKQKRKV